MNFGIALAAGMTHDDGNIVTRMGDVSIDDQATTDRSCDILANRLHHPFGGLRMAANGPHVSLDHG